jgi:hypothetical protein
MKSPGQGLFLWLEVFYFNYGRKYKIPTYVGMTGLIIILFGMMSFPRRWESPPPYFIWNKIFFLSFSH